jgi:F-type H+-transporting ATPase subunit b
MKTRRLLAATAFAALGLIAIPAAAYAVPAGGDEPAGEEELPGPAGHAEEECIHLLEEGKKIDDCQEAPNPILPAGNEIVWGALAFAVLFLALLKWGLPAVRKSMAAREERIKGDLERAEQARLEAESELATYRQQLAEAKGEATRILEEARQSADEVRRQIRAQAEQEAGDIRARAQEDAGLAIERARAEVQSQVADLAIELAERIVEHNLDRDTQIQLIENYINQVGSR